MMFVPPTVIEIFPAWTVGYRVDFEVFQRATHLRSVPPWILSIEHQVGGYTCGSAFIVGAILQFSTNLAKLTEEGARIIDGFRALGELGQLTAHDEFAELKPLTRTYGEEFSNPKLIALQRLLGKFLELPRILRGVEGLVEFEGCDPLRYFNGWLLVSGSQEAGAGRGSEGLSEVLDASSMVNTVRLGPREMEEIASLGKSVGFEEAPGIFLLWENSD